MAVTQYRVRVVKSFSYRGAAQEFSNSYYFDGGVPADWDALFDAVVLAEKTIYPSSVQIIACHGYSPSSNVAVANKTYATNGTASTTNAKTLPGDCTLNCRWATSKSSEKGHVVYVFSYWHGVMGSTTTGGPDDVLASQKTAADSYGNSWLNGITVGARVYKRTTPDGHATTGRTVDPLVGHRDFPR